MRLIDRDVDPAVVARSIAAKLHFMRFEALPDARRCTTNSANHDGSCLVCGDDQGESSWCRSLTPRA